MIEGVLVILYLSLSTVCFKSLISVNRGSSIVWTDLSVDILESAGRPETTDRAIFYLEGDLLNSNS